MKANIEQALPQAVTGADARVSRRGFLKMAAGVAGLTVIGAETPIVNFAWASEASAAEKLTAEGAAKKYGVEGDPFSTDAGNWEIVEDGKAAHFTPVPGEVARFKLGKKTVVDGYMDNPSSNPMGSAGGEWGVRAQTFVAAGGPNFDTLDARGGTFREGIDANHLLDQVEAKEAKEQPGIIVLPIGFKRDNKCVSGEAFEKELTPAVAAERYGDPDDAWSSDAANWDVFQEGDNWGAHLTPHETETARVKFGPNTTMEGYWDQPSSDPKGSSGGEGVRAQSFVAQNIEWLDARGVTVRENIDADQLFQDKLKVEAETQPDILTLPVGFKVGAAC